MQIGKGSSATGASLLHSSFASLHSLSRYKKSFVHAWAGPPMVLHYGNDLSVNNTSYNFSKIAVREAGFDATLCPPWDLTPKPGFQVAAGGLLPYPPSPLSLPSQVTQHVTTHPPVI